MSYGTKEGGAGKQGSVKSRLVLPCQVPGLCDTHILVWPLQSLEVTFYVQGMLEKVYNYSLTTGAGQQQFFRTTTLWGDFILLQLNLGS